MIRYCILLSCLFLGNLSWGEDTPPPIPRWYLSGYLANDSEHRKWITVEGTKILDIADAKPEIPALDGKGKPPLVLETDYWIYPGLINLNNRLKYSILPRWQGAKGQFNNRYEWRGVPSLQTATKPLLDFLSEPRGTCDSVRYGEILSLVSGVTTTAGISTIGEAQCAQRYGPRNIEIQGDLGDPGAVATSLDLFDPRGGEEIYNSELAIFKTYLNSENPLGFLSHLGSGMVGDSVADGEFDRAKEAGFFQKGLTLIGGNVFRETQFGELAKAQVGLVWAPLSDLSLYGRTLHIEQALRQKVSVSLSTDWAITGSRTLLDEIRFAKKFAHKNLPSRALLQMVTTHPAQAIGRSNTLGTIEKGYEADLLLLKPIKAIQDKSSYYRTVISARQDQVALVVVGGQPLYGENSFIEKTAQFFEDEKVLKRGPEKLAPKNQTQPQCKFEKSLRIPLTGVPTFSAIVSGWDAPPLFDCDHLENASFQDRFLRKELPEFRRKRSAQRAFEDLP